MTDREMAGCARLGQQADPPHMIQPPGCNYTPDEVGRMLGNRVVQPHYAAWLVRKALLNIGLIDAEAARQQHAADQATIAALREELSRRTPSSEGDGIPQVEGLTVEREAGALSQSGERFPDLFVIRLGDREDCVIKGEQPALWAMFDAAIAAAEGAKES